MHRWPGDFACDQASGLRRLFRPRAVRVLPIAGEPMRRLGELALALSLLGERVLILDHTAPRTVRSKPAQPDLAGILDGRSSFDEAAQLAGQNIRRLAVGEGFAAMSRAGITPEALFQTLGALDDPIDCVLLPTAHARAVAQLFDGQGEFLVVCHASAPSVTRAYQLLKSIITRGARVRLLFEDVDARTSAEQAFARIEHTACRFLGVVPLFAGWLPRESTVTEQDIARSRQPARSVASLARAMADWDVAAYGDGGSYESSPSVRSTSRALAGAPSR